MATALPFEGRLQLPIQWSGKVHKQVMRAGATSLSTTLGFNPTQETATLTWRLNSVAEARSLLEQLGPHFNDTYTYQCPVRGSILIRPTDSYEFNEYRAGYPMRVSVAVERV